MNEADEARVTHEEIERLSRQAHLRRAGGAVMSVFAIVVAVAALAWAVTNDTELDAVSVAGQSRAAQISDLSTALDAQREQFESCQAYIGKRTPEGCETPVAESAKAIVPSPAVVSGLPGLPGEPGERGPSGPPGVSGAPGASGASGASGEPGTAVTGAPGASGVPGAPGENGANGTSGTSGTSGADGERGPQGERGPAPASFTFTFLGQDYVCRDTDGDGDYTCTLA